jgi:hypothetical protein
MESGEREPGSDQTSARYHGAHRLVLWSGLIRSFEMNRADFERRFTDAPLLDGHCVRSLMDEEGRVIRNATRNRWIRRRSAIQMVLLPEEFRHPVDESSN